MECTDCKTTESPKWRNSYCSSCYPKRWRKNNKETVLNYNKTIEVRFRHSQRVAKKRKLDWQLSLNDFAKLCVEPCHYCSNKLGDLVSNGSGLDRINNSLGYIPTNILPCCKICNTIRNEFLTVEETEKVVNLILTLRNI